MNRKNILIALSGIFIALIISSCYYDKFNEMYPLHGYQDPCTSDTTYLESVRYIMAYNCTSCHNGNFSVAGIRLDTYEGVMSAAKSGRLMGAIEQRPGYTAMPPNNGSLKLCEYNMLKNWIDNGYKQ